MKIDVDDSAFARFHQLFADYTAAVEEQPEAWRKLGDAMGSATEGLAESTGRAKDALAIAAAQAGIIAEAISDAVKQQKSLGAATTESARSMDNLRRGAEGVGKAMAFLGGWVLKLGALGGITGILSAVSVADLASAALNRGRDAGRVGLNPGQLASFEVNAKRFLDVSALANAANAQNDVSKAGYLTTLGIGYGEAQNMSASDLAFEELRKATQAYLSAPKGLGFNMPAVQAYLALGGDRGDIRNAARLGIPALNAAQAASNRDAGTLGFSRRVEDAWAKLDIAFDKAGMTIETTLIDKLVPLAPVIERLTEDFTNWITGILSRPDLEEWINDAADGLRELATFLEGIDWRQIGNDIDYFADLLGLLKPDDSQSGEAKRKAKFGAWDYVTHPEDARTDLDNWFSTNVFGASGFQNISFGAGALGKMLGNAGSAIASTISGVAKSLGVDPLLAIATAQNESGLNPRSKGDYENGSPTSFGLYQLHQGGELGDLSPEQAFDPTTNAKVALSRFAEVQKMSAAQVLGQFSRAVRSYNPNITHAQIMAMAGTPGEYAAVAQRPADEYGYAKAINAKYEALERAAETRAPRRTPPAPSVKVSVYNSTAARVAVSANAVANT